MAVKVLSFSIFHELALELMEQWEIDNHRSLRHSADELAVIIMIMLKQGANPRELGRYFFAHPNVAASFRTELIDNWHPLSVERARKILVWLDNLDMVRSWQELLIPHMQTELLEWLQKDSTDWSDPTLVEKELAKRYKNLPPGRNQKEKRRRVDFTIR